MGKAKSPVTNRVGSNLFWTNLFLCDKSNFFIIIYFYFFLNFKYFFMWKKYFFFFNKIIYLNGKSKSETLVILGCLNILIKNSWFIIIINFFFKNFFFFFLKKINFLSFFKQKIFLNKKFFL